MRHQNGLPAFQRLTSHLEPQPPTHAHAQTHLDNVWHPLQSMWECMLASFSLSPHDVLRET